MIGPDSVGDFVYVENVSLGSIKYFCEYENCICNTSAQFAEEVESRITAAEELRKDDSEDEPIECLIGPNENLKF